MDTFPSTLIVSNSEKIIAKLVNSLVTQLGHSFDHNPDLLIIDTDYSISKVRQIQKFLSQKPFNHSSKIILIQHSDLLAAPAQNALLKSLEEPGDSNYFILTTTTPQAILPTIHSRCRLISKTSNITPIKTKILVSTGNIKADLSTADQLSADKTSVAPFLKNQLCLYQQRLLTDPSAQTQDAIDRLVTCLSMLSHHVDPKSVLDYFLLS